MRISTSDGYVTLAVLLMAGLLAAITASVLAVARPALGVTRVGGDQLAAEGLADGAVSAAAFLLFNAQKPIASVDGMVLRLSTGDVTIGAADEGARIDLNGADETLLEGLFRAVNGQSMSAQAFAARVVDWRDEDGDVTNDGAEATEYADRGLPYAPPNLPFHSVDELSFLLGLSPADFARLRPYVTVFSGAAGVDPLSATPTALRAIPYFEEKDIERIMKLRRDGADRSEIIALVPEAEEFLLTEASGVYRVSARARLSNGYTDAVEAVISAGAEEDSARFRVVAWSSLAPGAQAQ